MSEVLIKPSGKWPPQLSSQPLQECGSHTSSPTLILTYACWKVSLKTISHDCRFLNVRVFLEGTLIYTLLIISTHRVGSCQPHIVLGFWVQLDLENLSNERNILINIKVLRPEEKNLAFQPSGISCVETSIHRMCWWGHMLWSFLILNLLNVFLSSFT